MCPALEVYKVWFNHGADFQDKIINGDALAKNTKISVQSVSLEFAKEK